MEPSDIVYLEFDCYFEITKKAYEALNSEFGDTEFDIDKLLELLDKFKLSPFDFNNSFKYNSVPFEIEIQSFRNGWTEYSLPLFTKPIESEIFAKAPSRMTTIEIPSISIQMPRAAHMFIGEVKQSFIKSLYDIKDTDFGSSLISSLTNNNNDELLDMDVNSHEFLEAMYRAIVNPHIFSKKVLSEYSPLIYSRIDLQAFPQMPDRANEYFEKDNITEEYVDNRDLIAYINRIIIDENFPDDITPIDLTYRPFGEKFGEIYFNTDS